MNRPRTRWMRLSGALVAGGWLVAAGWVAPCGAALYIESAGASFVQSDWDLGLVDTDPEGSDGKPQEWVAQVWTELRLNRALAAQIQWNGCAAEEHLGRLGAADCSSGSLLLRYQRPRAPWLLQMGFRTGAATDPLSEDQRALSVRLAEPVLAAPQADPVRGARFHLSGVYGRPLSHKWDLLAGASFEFRGDVEPEAGVTVSPGNLLRFLGGFEYHTDRHRFGLQTGVTREGGADLEGSVLRESHTAADVSAWLAPSLGPFAVRLEGGWQRSGQLEWPSAAEYDSLVQGGPAEVWSSRVSLTPRIAWPIGSTWTIRPGLFYEHRRVSPKDLPFGEGWLGRLGPHLGFAGQGPHVDVSVAWLSGRWRPPYEVSRGPWREISGLEIRAAFSWVFRSATSR